jgi:hypothetical protein
MAAFLDYGMAAAGVAAAILVLTAYYGLETGRLRPDDPRYYTMNALSSLVLIMTIANQFDMADIGAVFMETCWLAISVKGLYRTKHHKKQQ